MFNVFHNVETGEITKVDLVGDELAEFIANEKIGKEAAEKEANQMAKIRAAKAAVLTRLGITAEEATLLLS